MIHVNNITYLVVGKSNILIKWTKNNFKSDHEITIGVEFGAKNIVVGKEDTVLRIQVWDTVPIIYY